MKKRYFLLAAMIIGLVTAFIFIPKESSRPTLINPTLQESQREENGLDETEIQMNEPQPIPEGEPAENEQVQLPDRITEAIQNTLQFFRKETQVVAIGDSLTQGVGDETERGGYVGIIERTINWDRDIAEFSNFGKRGSRSDQLLSRLNNDEEMVSALAKADMILVTIGANDIMQVVKENITNLTIKQFVEERQVFERNLEEIINRLHELNPDSQIYLIGFYNPFERYFQDIEELQMIADAWNDTTNTLADQHENITYIPTDDLFHESEVNLLAEDNFHPNYNGYHLIAGRVLEYITNEES
ncbi:hypothetical protein D8M04_14795 [Oceanobacillus piezotolerans]|uniref:SGNH hydrolase-type esterase domain-containing protein n=1 Tax=Oceanobacillus piezotolerans TaxID=2448030 RepID=A0A498DK60_9BACI|nr:SGNH/GDSL hydrolase family protein [Oceanobacillus piezotolerans]RLL42815.1 hypothetical protein D8M04_14795 [Oceanobacillus piezotolerans]